jgi:hypothetical protein
LPRTQHHTQTGQQAHHILNPQVRRVSAEFGPLNIFLFTRGLHLHHRQRYRVAVLSCNHNEEPPVNRPQTRTPITKKKKTIKTPTTKPWQTHRPCTRNSPFGSA